MTHPLSSTAAHRLRSLEESGAAAPAVAWLRRTIAEGSDFDCYNINAFRVAEETGLSRLEAVRAFLFATRLGVTDLSWDLHCPSCQGMSTTHRRLADLRGEGRCPLCELRFDVAFEDQVEVSFTVNADVRPIALEQFAEASWPAAAPQVTQRLAREGRRLELAAATEPGARAEVRGVVIEGDYRCQLLGFYECGARLRVEGAPVEQEQVVALEFDASGTASPGELTLRPGPVRLVVGSGLERPWYFTAKPLAPPRCWVSAAYVTGLQDFRDLFSGEFLAPDLFFAIRSTTLLFTDVKGSTEMYERLGDAAAYALVQEHFRLMTEVIRRREGGVVKTIGDAVMASFRVNRDAVAAALEIQQGFARVSPPLSQIEVKIGLHRGPAIAVTSNRLLDFFGRTVNLAARVQGHSRAGEVLLSDEVAGDPEVAKLLADSRLPTSRLEASLKGIAGQVPLTSVMVRPGPAAAAASHGP